MYNNLLIIFDIWLYIQNRETYFKKQIYIFHSISSNHFNYTYFELH